MAPKSKQVQPKDNAPDMVDIISTTVEIVVMKPKNRVDGVLYGQPGKPITLQVKSKTSENILSSTTTVEMMYKANPKLPLNKCKYSHSSVIMEVHTENHSVENPWAKVDINNNHANPPHFSFPTKNVLQITPICRTSCYGSDTIALRLTIQDEKGTIVLRKVFDLKIMANATTEERKAFESPMTNEVNGGKKRRRSKSHCSTTQVNEDLPGCSKDESVLLSLAALEKQKSDIKQILRESLLANTENVECGPRLLHTYFENVCQKIDALQPAAYLTNGEKNDGKKGSVGVISLVSCNTTDVKLTLPTYIAEPIREVVGGVFKSAISVAGEHQRQELVALQKNNEAAFYMPKNEESPSPAQGAFGAVSPEPLEESPLNASFEIPWFQDVPSSEELGPLF